MGTRIDGRRVLRSTTSVLRFIGQVVITVALVFADVVKSGSGGGGSSSALPPVVLPRSETTPSDPLFSKRKVPTKKMRRKRRRPEPLNAPIHQLFGSEPRIDFAYVEPVS